MSGRRHSGFDYHYNEIVTAILFKIEQTKHSKRSLSANIFGGSPITTDRTSTEQLSKPAAVTGMGTISPLGSDLETTWTNLKDGASGVVRVEDLEADGLENTIAAPVKGYDPDAHFDGRRQKRLDPYTQYGLIAVREALKDAGYDEENPPWDAERVGVVAGSGIGGIHTTEDQHKRLMDRGAKRVSPMTVPRQLINMLSGQIAKAHGFKGPSSAIVTACATSLDSIGLGLQWIRSGRADTVIVGGAEESITPLPIAGFKALKALAERPESPEQASRPFDKDREGFVMGAGAGMLVLEDPEQAQERGADVHGWIEGYAQTNDAHHETSPPDDGEGAARAMEGALKDAEVTLGDVDHINAHATSTPTGDAAEVRAIESVFADTSKPSVTATKSMTGHLLGGAGSLEAIICLKSLMDDFAPPTINCDNPEPVPEFEIVQNEGRNEALSRGINNAFGFGGHNASMVLRANE
ncbi:MAG: beta-ketoacyl-ACP synthase II [bacterium]